LSQQPAQTKLVLATGGPGGTYHPYGESLAKILSSKLSGVSVAAQVTGASIENVRLVNKKEAQLAIAQSDIMDYAFNGREFFKEKLTNIRAITILYPEMIQIVVRADSGIESILDLKGKKVGVGAPGSGSEVNFRQLVDTYGMDGKSLTQAYLSFAESAEQFNDKNIDGFIITAGIPNVAVADLAAHENIKILSPPDDIVAKMVQKYPFLTPVTIPANTYRGQTAPVRTIALQAALIVNSDVREDLVYNMTKTLFENQADLARANAKGKELNLDTATTGISIPLHSGALKYYREKGIIK
jgi:TRAP transporter TAXI family solute receptor